MSVTLLSIDQIINYSIGADLMNEFMTWQIVGSKKDDGKWYTTDTMSPTYSKTSWEDLVNQTDYYSENNSIYTKGEFWGASVKMQKSDDGSPKSHNFGSLFYNVPNSESKTDDTDVDYYVIAGDSLQGEDKNNYTVKFYVPIATDNSSGSCEDINSCVFTNVATSSPYQQLKGGFTVPGNSAFSIEQGTTYQTTSSTTVSRSFGVDATIAYKLKTSIENEGKVKESVEQTLKVSAEVNFQNTEDDYNESKSTLTVDSTVTYTNNSPNPYQFVPYTNTTQSQSTYEITGKLGSTYGAKTSDDNSVVQYYVQKNGKKKYPQTKQLSVYDALNKSKEAIAYGGTATDLTLAGYIDPENGYVTTTGTFTSTNASSGNIYYFFYDDQNNCYSSTGANQDDCDCDRNSDVGVKDTCVESNSSGKTVSSRYARNQELEFDKEMFTLSKLKDMHKTKPIVNDTILGESNGNTYDVPVGSMAETSFLAYAIGSDVHDWHTNKAKDEYGGSILHGGTDQYDGNSGRDFVSSKSFGGASRINTKAGRDTVLIDVKKVNKFTPGHTSLGKGGDTILYRGSGKNLTGTGTEHEFLKTGKGKDEIIVKKNVKLYIDDFDLKKDTLRIDSDRYLSQISGHDIIFSNDEGGSVILRDVFSNFNGSIDSLPFSLGLTYQ